MQLDLSIIKAAGELMFDLQG